MRRSRPSELYQVDFVAALFGGFLLVWLSGVQEAEFPSPGGEGLTVFELNVRAHFLPKDGAGPPADTPIVPMASEQVVCAHTALVAKLAEAGRLVFACKGLSTRRMGTSDKKEWLNLQAERAAREAKTGRASFQEGVFGVDFSPVFASGSGEIVGKAVGTVFSTEVGTFGVEQLGILPADVDPSLAPSIEIRDWVRRSYSMILTDGHSPTSGAVTPVDIYRVDDASNVFLTDGVQDYEVAINGLSVELRIIKGGAETCFQGEIAATTPRQQLVKC